MTNKVILCKFLDFQVIGLVTGSDFPRCSQMQSQHKVIFMHGYAIFYLCTY